MIGNFLKKQNGFTLMEMLVSMSIFVLLTLTILNIHTTILHNSQQTLTYNKVQQEAQYIMQLLAKKIRTARVNYDYATYQDQILDDGVSRIETNELSIIDVAGTEFVFFENEDEKSIQTKSRLEGEEFTTAKTLTSGDIVIENLTFLIEPKTYPFSLDAPPETQPRVTMVVTFTSTQAQKNKTLTIQQTIPQLSGGVVE